MDLGSNPRKSTLKIIDLIIMGFDPSIGNYGVRAFSIDPSKILGVREFSIDKSKIQGKCMNDIKKGPTIFTVRPRLRGFLEGNAVYVKLRNPSPEYGNLSFELP